MDEQQLFGGIAAIAALLGGMALVYTLAAITRRHGRAVEVGDGVRTGRMAWLVRHGIKATKPLARALGNTPTIRPLVQEGVWVFEQRGYRTTEEALFSVYLACLVVLSAVAGIVSWSLVGACAVGCCVCALTVAWLRSVQDKRREALRDAVPDALRSMGVCFQSGLSLLQTFHQVARESTGPLSNLFQRAAHRLEVGQSAGEALATIRESAAVPELSFVAVALDVQHQAGGSMRRVLEAARESVESQIELRRSLKVQTAQARLSARVVSVMPFVLVAIFSLVSEGFLLPFFESVAGLVLLGVALGMQAAGIVMVRKMLKVDVG